MSKTQFAELVEDDEDMDDDELRRSWTLEGSLKWTRST